MFYNNFYNNINVFLSIFLKILPTPNFWIVVYNMPI